MLNLIILLFLAGSPQIINIPVSLLAQNGQQPISLITSNGQIFQLPVSQLVVQQNADGTTTTTTTQGVNQNVSSGGAGTTSSAASSSSATTTNATQLVINQQGQLISLPVIQTATTSQGNNLGNNVQAVNFVSLAGSNNNANNNNNNNVSLQIINRSTNNNTNTNGQTPIKSLLDDDDKSNTSLDDQGQTIAQMPLSQATILNASGGISHTGTTVDGVNLDEIREFAKAFKLRRLALGLTQTQVGQALSATKGPAYSQSAICRFEKLDITPKSAAKIKPVLEKWMQEAELKYADR
jgi:class 6 POU domain transcription factor